MNLNIVDIIVLIFIGLSIFTGIKKGFVMSLFDLLGIIVSFFIAKEYYHLINNFLINNTKLDQKINEFISEKLAVIIEDLGEAVSLENIFNGFEQLPFDLKMMFNDLINNSGGDIVGNATVLSDKITALIMTFISFTIAILFAFLILFIIANAVNAIVKAPVLNLANKVLGGGIGIVKSVLILYLVFALATPFIMFSDKDSNITDKILESTSGEIFYENNIILNYLSYKNIID
jgi:uncharacterized membrane protein required for colicin V production